jgi:hypothetical protein
MKEALIIMLSKKFLNYTILILALLGGIWFGVANFTPTEKEVPIKEQMTNESPREVTQKDPEEIDWKPFLPMVTSVLIFFLKYFLYDYKKESKTLEKPNTEIVIEHPIFKELENLTMDISHYTFGNEGRTELFRDMLRIKYTVFGQLIKKFQEQKHVFNSPVEFRNAYKELIREIQTDYEEKWAVSEIPSIVVDKFRKIRSPRIALLYSDIDTIAFYKAQDDYDQAGFYILTTLLLMLKFGLTFDNLKTLKELNGELSNIKYKGKCL